MAGITPALALLDLALQPRVQKTVGKVFDSVYGRIFKETKIPVVEGPELVRGPTDRELLEKLLAAQPSNEEMALAFSSLQTELRRGQQRLWLGLGGFGALNAVLLLILILK